MLINNIQNISFNNWSTISRVKFKPQNYALVLVGFRMSVMDGFDLYDKLLKISIKVEDTPTKEFKICFMTSSVINYKVLAEIHRN